MVDVADSVAPVADFSVTAVVEGVSVAFVVEVSPVVVAAVASGATTVVDVA